MANNRTIHITGEDAAALRKRAVECNMSDIAFIRKAIYDSELKFISVYTDDLDRFFDEVHTVTSAVDSLVYMIRTKGAGQVYAQDIAELKELCRQMIQLQDRIFTAYYNDRRSIRKKMVDEIRSM